MVLKKKNFKLDFEWEWRELGLGCIIYKPLYRRSPYKCFWIGISFRLLWFGFFIKLIDRRLITVDPEIYDENERIKEISSFHYKELIVFKNHGSLDVSWDWTHLGLMIYHRSSEGYCMPGCISIDIMWFTVSHNFNPKESLT